MKTRIPGVRLVNSPGPSPIPSAILAAMHEQSLDLADPQIDTVITRCESGLLSLTGAAPDSRVYLFISNGHGVWESALVNLIRPGQQVLIPSTGHFSDSWSEIAVANEIETVRTQWTPGLPIDPQEVADVLRKDLAHKIDAIFVVHTDTATGVTNDLKAIREAINSTGHPALLVIDAVASLAATPFSMQECGADVALGSSQKGLMMPAGLSFIVASPRAREFSSKNQRPRHYWNWQRREGSQNYQKFCGTPPLQFLLGLQTSLNLLEDEGLEKVYQRHRRLTSAVHAAVEQWSQEGYLEFFCKDPLARSVSVTAVSTKPEVNALAIRHIARERFRVGIAGGVGTMFGKAFRIGHLGDHNEATILACLVGVESALDALEVPRGRDAIASAIASLQTPLNEIYKTKSSD